MKKAKIPFEKAMKLLLFTGTGCILRADKKDTARKRVIEREFCPMVR